MRSSFRGVSIFLVLLLSHSVFAAFPVGDLDRNFLVDFDDLVLFAQQWMLTPDCFNTPGCADLEGNDDVNFEDFALIAQNWQQRGEITLSINELMASNDTTLQDPDEPGEYPDWIEIYNYGTEAITLTGMYLQDSANTYLIPSGVSIAAGQYLIFYADDDKDPVDQGPLHTNFKLGASGDEVTLLSYDGQTIVDTVSFSGQIADISYGQYQDATGNWYTMDSPSPGLTNNVGQAGEVYFSRLSGTFVSNFDLTLSTTTPSTTIRYTTDGSMPTASSTAYSGPISISNSTGAKRVRARAYHATLAPGPVQSHYYTPLASDVQNFSSNLPIVIIETHGVGMDWGEFSTAYSTVVIDLDKDTGLASMQDIPDYAGRSGLHVRGESSAAWPKKQYALELWDDSNMDMKASLLGMSSESDWILNAPYGDKTLMRNALAFKWANDIEDEYAAPRTKFVEVFLNDDGGDCSYADYNGVYVLMEKIKVSDDRVNIAKLDPTDTTSPDITGGYILRVDKNYSSEFEDFTTSANMVNNPIQYFDPDQDVLVFEQKQYIQSFFDQFETDLNDAEFNDPNAGYAQHVDIESFIEYDVIAEIFKNADGLKLSTYFHKERSGKLNFGPHWDYNFSAGNTRDVYPQLGYSWWYPSTFRKTTTSEGWFNQTMPVYGWHSQMMADADYMLKTADKWFEHREDKLSDAKITADIDYYFNLLDADGAADRNFAKWNILNNWEMCNYYYGNNPQTEYYDYPTSGETPIPIPSGEREQQNLSHTFYMEKEWLKNWFNGEGTPTSPEWYKDEYTDRVGKLDTFWASNRNIDAPPTLLVDGVPMNTGGTITTGSTLTMTSPSGTIYYTTDGTDPRLWTYWDNGEPDPGVDPFTRTLVAESASKKVLVPTAEVVSSTATGSILREYWTDIAGSTVSDLTSDLNYPNSPTVSDLLTTFETPIDWADNYGTRVRGYLHPTTSGSYTFWIASDDSSSLGLSIDDNPNNADLIASVSGWTSPREWNKYGEQQSTTISLTAGQKYYIEALHKEGTGGDNLAVAWDGPGISGPGVIDGAYLSPLRLAWVGEFFDDSSWTSTTGGVGYDTGSSYDPYIGYDVESLMLGGNNTCYTRTAFTVDSGDLPHIDTLKLRVRFDDAFIAYINGVEVARSSLAPVFPAWNSNATGYTDPETTALIEFDISAYISELNPGSGNTLAVHGLNSGNTSSDFLISFELEATSAGVPGSGGGTLIAGGAVSPTAMTYSGGMTLNDSTRIKARVKNGSDWTALNEAIFSDSRVASSLRITEIMYHPVDPNDEYIEFKNIGPATIDLAHCELTKGVDFTFPSVTLAPNAYTIVVRNTAEFNARYPVYSGTIAGEYTNDKLDNGGENIRLKDAAGTIIQEFDYEDGWFPITDGAGYSINSINLTPTDPNDWNKRLSWEASNVSGGTPGAAHVANDVANDAVVINEILTHTDLGDGDWIELHNTTGAAISVDNWYLSDDKDNLKKYKIPATTPDIPAGGYAVFTSAAHFGGLFGLSEHGEDVFLTSGNVSDIAGGYSVSESFGSAKSEVTFGRYTKSDGNVDFVEMTSVTQGYVNPAPAYVPDVVISEIMYNAQDIQDQLGEYIELHNRTGSTVYLYDTSNPSNTWKFTKGIDFTFPTGISIGAGQKILISRTHPDAFKAANGLTGVTVYGPFASDTELENDGEKIELSMPTDPDPGTGFISYIRVEQVNYSDGIHPLGNDPWPTDADGRGDSLHRTTLSDYANDVANWTAATPTPGS